MRRDRYGPAPSSPNGLNMSRTSKYAPPRTTYDPVIEQGIPRPPIARSHGGGGKGVRRRVRIPYDRMGIDDSVFVPGTDSTALQLHNAITQHRARTGTEMRFSVREWLNGFRVWRIK
jgi:hypothetical protein